MRAVRKMLTGDDLVAIEVRTRAVTRQKFNTHQTIAIALDICRRDVPDLLVEVRRLREALAQRQAEHTTDEPPPS